MKNKKGNTVVLTIRGMDWFLLTYLVIIFFIPQVISLADMFVQPFMNVYIAVYNIMNTIILTFGFFGLVVIYIMTYTTKFDDSKKEPAVPEYSSLWKFIIGLIKNILIIYFAYNFGMNYVAAITSLAIICSFFYFVVQRDFFAKMTKLKLAYK